MYLYPMTFTSRIYISVDTVGAKCWTKTFPSTTWQIIPRIYVFNTFFDGEYDGKLKKDKKDSPAGIWTHNFEKKQSLSKRVTKKESL